MYKCSDCNMYFDTPKIVRGNYHPETTPPSYEPDVGACPFCGSTEYDCTDELGVI